MITDLRGGTIWSEDPDNLLPFYRDLLGLPVTIQIPGVVVLGDLAAPTLVLGTPARCGAATRTLLATWWVSRAMTSMATGSG